MPNLCKCENNQAHKKSPPKPQLSNPLKKKKLNFKTCKKNTINSLNEVEHFLRDFKHFSRYIKLYKILK